MTPTVHIVTSRYVPQSGGLERWTRDLAHALHEAGVKPVVYVCEERTATPENSPFEVVDIAPLRAPWVEPLAGGVGRRVEQERARVTFTCVRNEVARRLDERTPIVMSNFITTAGFTAHLVAEALDLPHVPVIAGTDLNRGFRDGTDRQLILEVCRFARLVVGKSEEQVRTIRRRLPDVATRVIETSVELPRRRWAKAARREVVIFSDSGFSFKKGTGVLMDAFAALRREGAAARLEICGSDQPGQEGYWHQRRQRLESDFGRAVEFPGYLTVDELLDRIGAADLYASATLGEGASAARARALCTGVPMVTTSCGELADASNARHVRLVPVGDAAAFHRALHDSVAELLADRMTVDDAAVDRFRARFEPRKEWAEWLTVLHSIAR